MISLDYPKRIKTKLLVITAIICAISALLITLVIYNYIAVKKIARHCRYLHDEIAALTDIRFNLARMSNELLQHAIFADKKHIDHVYDAMSSLDEDMKRLAAYRRSSFRSDNPVNEVIPQAGDNIALGHDEAVHLFQDAVDMAENGDMDGLRAFVESELAEQLHEVLYRDLNEAITEAVANTERLNEELLMRLGRFLWSYDNAMGQANKARASMDYVVEIYKLHLSIDSQIESMLRYTLSGHDEHREQFIEASAAADAGFRSLADVIAKQDMIGVEGEQEDIENLVELRAVYLELLDSMRNQMEHGRGGLSGEATFENLYEDEFEDRIRSFMADGKLEIEESHKTLVGYSYDSSFQTLLIVTLAVSIIFLYIVFLIRGMMASLNTLKKGMAVYGRGNFSHRVELKSGDELRYLSSCFNAMADNIQKYEEEIKNISITDELTGLLNRRGFLEYAEHEFARLKRSDRGLVLIYADVDNFKRINDTFGHDIGDRVLIEVSEILRRTFRGSEIISRFGGDEFAILLADVSGPDNRNFMNRLQSNIDEYNSRGERVCAVSLSTGVVYHGSNSTATVSDVISQADSLMYEDKIRKKKEIKK